MDHLSHSPWFALTMLVCILGEAIWRTRVARRSYNIKVALASLGVAAGNIASGSLSAAALAALFFGVARVSPLHWSVRDWRVWVACFVLVEFAYYWAHRLSHEVRWLWATHAVHHSSEEMTFLSAVRLGWTNLFSGGWLFYLPIVFAGFDPRMVFGLLTVSLHYQFFLHTEAFGSWGPLEWLLNTPAHHRVHHASNAAYLDCNYGGVLIVFDRLFGSFVAERGGEPIRYGLAHPFGTNNPIAIVFGEWRRLFADVRRAPDLHGAVRAAFGRP